MSDNSPGWQPDPTGKHDHRYWDGSQWTDNVADAGVASTDPFVAPTEALPVVDEPTAPSPIDPTLADAPPPPSDPTAAWPAAPAPPVAYTPEGPVEPSSGSKRGLLIGGGIVAAIVIAAIAFFALSGDDDDGNDLSSDTTLDGADDATTTTGDDGGTDPELSDLRDACADGNFEACDDLYLQSDIGSDDEDFGSTCGDRAAPQYGECAATNGGEDDQGDDFGGIDPGTDPEEYLADFYESQMGLSRDQAECLAGKMAESSEIIDPEDDEAFTAIMDYLSECDISMSDLTP